VGKLLQFPETEVLDTTIPADVMAEIRRVCFHDRKRIAAFVAMAIEEKLRAGKTDPSGAKR
jgi:hypothetical protein